MDFAICMLMQAKQSDKTSNTLTARNFLQFARLILRLCATHIATLRDACCDFVRPMLRLCETQASCGSLESRSQKARFGNPIRSQHESRTSARVVSRKKEPLN